MCWRIPRAVFAVRDLAEICYARLTVLVYFTQPREQYGSPHDQRFSPRRPAVRQPVRRRAGSAARIPVEPAASGMERKSTVAQNVIAFRNMAEQARALLAVA